MSTRWRQKCTLPPKTSCLIPLGRCLIHDRPGGVLSLKPLGQQSCLSYVWPMFKKERRMAFVKKEGTRERKWTRKSGKNFCVGLAQYGSLDPEAVLSFPEGNENKETNPLPSKPGMLLVISWYLYKRTRRVNHNATILDTESGKTIMANCTF